MIQNTNYGASKTYVDGALSNIYTKAEVDTALATKADDDAVVHKAGAETIPGVKTFTGAPIISHDDDNLNLQNPNFTIGTAPSSTKWATLNYTDSTNTRHGMIALGTSSLGNSEMRFRVYDYNHAHNAVMGLFASANGNTYLTAPTRGYNQGAAYTNDVATIGTLDAYTPMARLANDQEFLGVNTFTSLITNGLWNNKSTVCTSANNDNTVFKRLYIMSNSGGSQYATIILLITPKRIHKDHAGILMVGNNRNASLTVHWLVKPDAVNLSDFVATREGSTNTIWCRSYGTDADGYHAIKLAEHGTSDLAGDRWTEVVNDTGEIITSAGYTDGEGVTHTFDRYVEAS